MAIYTPRGLKVRIAIPYAFGLMARLYPKVSPFRVLKTTEGIECLPGMLAFFAGIFGFVMHLPPFYIGLVVAVCYFSGVLINAFGFYIIPGLVGLGTFYSYFAGYGIYLIIIIVTGYALGGWTTVLAFFVGKILAAVVSQILEYWQTRRYHKLTGHAFTVSEVSFFNAYRLHASRIDVTTNIDLRDDEMEENHWGPIFERFAFEWPDIVQRFTIN